MQPPISSLGTGHEQLGYPQKDLESDGILLLSGKSND